MVLHQAHEVAGLGPSRAVFRQIAAGLAHHPDRRDIYGLLEQGTKETVVLQGGHGRVLEKSAGIFADPKTKGTAGAVPFVHRVNLSRANA
jgi:hypothetical protein